MALEQLRKWSISLTNDGDDDLMNKQSVDSILDVIYE
jgi:hypothetical protein